MNEEEKKEALRALQSEDLEKTTSFHDVMGRREEKMLKKMKAEEAERKEVEKEALEKHLLEKRKLELEHAAYLQEKQRQQQETIRELLPNEDPFLKEPSKHNPPSISLSIFAFLSFLLGLIYLIYLLLFNHAKNNQLYMIIQTTLFLFTSFTFLLGSIMANQNKKKCCYTGTALSMILFTSFHFLVVTNLLKLPTLPTLDDFTNRTLQEALVYAEQHHITIEQEYVYSDTYPEYQIVGQGTQVGTLLREVEKLKLIVSKGPNYDETVVLPVMTGWTVEQVLEYIETNFLNHVQIEYEIHSSIAKDTVISQSKVGQIRRNDLFTLKFSLGRKEDLPEVKMIDLKGKSLFEAELWLKRNGIHYKKSYVFHNEIERNYVVSTDTTVDTLIKPFGNTITLVISKGKEIKVPDLTKLSSSEIVNWVIENNLKIEFKEAYDEKIEKGKIIRANYKENDTIEEETTIIITTSKGPLILEKVNSLSELRNWASNNKITLSESYEFHDSISKGSIIKVYPTFGEVIRTGSTVKVTISNGKPVQIPNFVGKSKSEIASQCSNLGLSCSYASDGYHDSIAKDVATRQSKKAGSEVVSGTSITIYLSAGKAQTYTILIQSDWFGASINSADAGINMLKSKLSSMAPGVNFSFVKKASNSLPAGYIHENSPIKGMQTYTVKAGQTYTIWISA